MSSNKVKLPGLLALSPIIVFLVVYLVSSLLAGDFYKVPVSAAFLLASVYAVGITRGKLIDRDYPIYNYPFQNLNLEAKNYVNFIRYQTQSNHLLAERFDVGRNDQISLCKNPKKYNRYFQTFNLAANGIVWTGKELNCIPLFALKHNFKYCKNEKAQSIALRINYGKFSYYTGADLSGNIEWKPDSITTIDYFVGRTCGKVDVCKTNDGCSSESMSKEFIQSIQADNFIVMPWNNHHLDPVTMERLINPEKKSKKPIIFSTQYPEKYNPQKQRFMWGDYACPHTGNIVIKVANKTRLFMCKNRGFLLIQELL